MNMPAVRISFVVFRYFYPACNYVILKKNYFVCSYDHLRKEASQFRPAPESDRKVEQWRSALESEFTNYVKNYYKFGVSTVYGSSSDDGVLLIACIESHQFSPKNFW
jgi:hypothetical protein